MRARRTRAHVRRTHVGGRSFWGVSPGKLLQLGNIGGPLGGPDITWVLTFPAVPVVMQAYGLHSADSFGNSTSPEVSFVGEMLRPFSGEMS